MPHYYAPYRNHYYSRFSTGFFLQPLFYGSSYWIGNPYDYRLPPAPPGTQWVRYYNDVLLVDIYLGRSHRRDLRLLLVSPGLPFLPA